MQDSKFIETLRQLSGKELSGFKSLVSSKYFNSSQELSTLLDLIVRHSPNYVNKGLSKELIWKVLRPRQEYQSKTMVYLISELNQLLSKYISLLQYEEQPVLNAYNLAIAYTNMGLDKPYRSTIKEARSDQERSVYRDSNYYYNEYLLDMASNNYFDKQKKRSYDLSLQNATDNLDNFYLITKLKFSCELINRGLVVSSGYELKLLNEITGYLGKNINNEVPAVSIYYTILQLLLHPEKGVNFQALKELLDTHSNKFPKPELKDMYAYAQNYCVREINKGNSEFLPELFGIYKTSLERRLMFSENKISPWIYKNIAGVGLRLGEYQWVEEFTNEYQQFILEEYQEGSHAFNLANVRFYQKEYRDALRLLQQVEFTDLYYYMDTKFMMLKIYYELDDESFFSVIDAVRVYINRNRKMPDYLRKSYRNFLKFILKVRKIDSWELYKLKPLKQHILATKEVVNLDWLIDKIDEKGKFAV